MRRFLFVLQGIIPEESVTWRRVSEEEFLGPGMCTSIATHSELTLIIITLMI